MPEKHVRHDLPAAANDLATQEPAAFDRLTRDVRVLEQHLLQLRSEIDEQRDGRPPDDPRPWSAAELLHERAAAIYRDRRRREEAFGTHADIFADPAYDILLDLFAAEGAGKSISVSSLCIAAAVPGTTALRTLAMMQERGLLARRADPHDRRRTYIYLTPLARQMMRDWLSALG